MLSLEDANDDEGNENKAGEGRGDSGCEEGRRGTRGSWGIAGTARHPPLAIKLDGDSVLINARVEVGTGVRLGCGDDGDDGASRDLDRNDVRLVQAERGGDQG